MRVTADDILDAMKKAIKAIEKLIDELNDLEDEMESYETKRNIAKSVGTTINVAGAGLAVGAAFFTGGLSLLAGSLVTTVVGTGANLVTDFVDREETKTCMERIQRLLDELEKVITLLKDLIDKFNQQVEETMETDGTDFQTAFLQELGSPPNFNFKSLTVALMVTYSRLLTDALKSLTVSEIKAIETVFGATLSASTKAGGAVAGGTVVGGGKMLGKVIGRSAAVFGVAICAIEVVNLFKSFSKDHPTLDAIKNIKRDVRKQKKSLETSCKDFKKLQETARKTCNEGIINLMKELFGGGYRQSQSDIIEPLQFNDFVNQIGTGSEGGIFHIAFIAEMTGRPIEITDRTDDRSIFRLQGNEKLNITPFRLRSLTPIRLIITGANGQHHFSPVGNDGSPIDLLNIHPYSNRCLFDAIAYVLGIPTDRLIENLKQFLRASPIAEEVFNENMAELFPEFRGGARRINGDPARRTQIQRSGDERQQIVTATVRFENLNQGANATSRIRRNMRIIGFIRDDAGHVIAFCLGGAGNDPNNFAPMTIPLNRVAYRMIEVETKRILERNEGWYTEIRVTLTFDPESENPLRPVRIRFEAKFYDRHGNLQNFDGAERFDKTFNN